MADTFIIEQIEVVKKEIVSYDSAILAFGDANIQSYTLDTGQDRQVVTRSDIASITNSINSVYNRYATRRARCGIAGGVIIVKPAW